MKAGEGASAGAAAASATGWSGASAFGGGGMQQRCIAVLMLAALPPCQPTDPASRSPALHAHTCGSSPRP